MGGVKIGNKPYVTILLAFYNEKKYMKKAIASVKQQSYSNWQLILLDDGSTNKSKNWILPIIKNDSRIQYKRFRKNQGKGKILNEGLKIAEGEYVLELDADDWLYPLALQLFVDYMQKLPSTVALVYSDYVTVKKVGKNLMKHQAVVARPFLNRIQWVKNYFVPIPRFYRKEALLAIGGWVTDYPSEGRLYEDIATVFRLLKHYQMAYLPKRTMVVRRRYDSITYKNRNAWYSMYKYLLARALQEWNEPYLVDVDLKNKISIKEKKGDSGSLPLVSLLISYPYHSAILPYLRQSIAHQTYPNIETIFINDHSISKETLKLANGKYVLILSPFEILNPECIEIFVDTMEEKERKGEIVLRAIAKRKKIKSKSKTILPDLCIYHLDLIKKADWTSIDHSIEKNILTIPRFLSFYL